MSSMPWNRASGPSRSIRCPRYFMELSPTYRAGDPEGMKRYLAMITEGMPLRPMAVFPSRKTIH